MKCLHCGHDIPEGKTLCIYCGAVVRGMNRSTPDQNGVSGNGPEGISDFIEGEDSMTQELTRLKSRRKKTVSKAALVFIFLLSMLLGGLVVWLFK